MSSHGNSDLQAAAPSYRFSTLLERRPIVAALLVVLAAKLALPAGLTVSSGIAGAPSTPVGALVALLVLGLIPVAVVSILRHQGWASLAGFNRPAQWQKPWLATPIYAYALVNLSGLIGKRIDAAPDWHALLLAGVQAISVPLIEESVFRGLVLAILLNHLGVTQRGIVRAVLLSAVLFGLWHATVALSPNVAWQQAAANIVYACFAGVGFAAVVLRTRSIWLVMLGHALIVFSNVLVSVLIAGQAVSTNAIVPPEQASRTAILSVLITVPLLLYGLWLLRDTNRLEPGYQ